jgi:hypothetical protein
MRLRFRIFFVFGAFLGLACLAVSISEAQPGGKKGSKGGNETVDEFVNKIMAFNKAKDGKLTKEELTDRRLHGLFERADTKKQGYVTRADLEALFAREKLAGGFGFGFGDKGKGGFGDDFKGKGKGFGKKGFPQPGQILSPFLQDELELSDTQRRQLADLQKEVDSRLAKILTEEQRKQLREMRGKGPKGPKGPPPD